jgi:aromatic-ring opening dioxygenase LigAB LigA subunit
MSIYALQKLIRDVNRDPRLRENYFVGPEQFAKGYELTDVERSALLSVDLTRLYALGVHGLLLKPFSILHSVSEPDYLAKIRESA